MQRRKSAIYNCLVKTVFDDYMVNNLMNRNSYDKGITIQMGVGRFKTDVNTWDRQTSTALYSPITGWKHNKRINRNNKPHQIQHVAPV